jgi:hypothetical protein
VALVWLWCGCGVALVWLWCGFGVAVVWLWCGFVVALGWLCSPESMPSICLVYGFEVALGGLSAGASRKSENSVIMRIARTEGVWGRSHVDRATSWYCSTYKG